MVNLANQPVKKLLGYAIRAEMDANRMYTRMADRVKNTLLKEKFQLLALEEKKQLVQLLERTASALNQPEHAAGRRMMVLDVRAAVGANHLLGVVE